MTTNIALRRSRRRGWSPLAVMRRRRRVAASACQATASGTISTRCPAAARPASTGRGRRGTAAGGVEPAELVPDVAADQHAGAWRPTARRGRAVVLALVELAAAPARCPCGPLRSTVTPTSSSRRRSSQSRSFGPSTPALRILARRPRAGPAGRAASGAQSSCSSQIHSCSVAGSAGGAQHLGRRRAPKPVERGQGEHVAAAERPRSGSAGASRPCCRCRRPTTRSGRRLWEPARRSVSPSQRAPSWATTTAVTSGGCVAGGMHAQVRGAIGDAAHAYVYAWKQGRFTRGQPVRRTLRTYDSSTRRTGVRLPTLDPAALPLGQPAPDAEPLIVLECVLQALGTHLARRQTFLASRVEPPFSGKNASGSVCAHSARSCQPSSSASS